MLNWFLVYAASGVIAYLTMCAIGAMVCTYIKADLKYCVMAEIEKFKTLSGIRYIAFDVLLWPAALVISASAWITLVKNYKNGL